MALPVEPQHTEELYKEVLSFLWTMQVEGQSKQKRRLVAKERLSPALELGGPGISHQDETIRGFQQNLLQKIYKKRLQNPTASLSSIVLGLLDRANQPTMDQHVKVLWAQTVAAYRVQA
jgi:hypothetical protein